jgi:hypothetical protein
MKCFLSWVRPVIEAFYLHFVWPVLLWKQPDVLARIDLVLLGQL